MSDYLYCGSCNTEIDDDEYSICEMCDENVARCDGFCVECAVEFYAKNSFEFDNASKEWANDEYFEEVKNLVLQKVQQVDAAA
jgi:predicted amidophosphoribosyltransferase